MKPRLDIRPVLSSLKGIGYGVQLSDCEGDCYFTRECEALGVPLLVTPVPSFNEQGLVDGKNCYYIPFDVENVDVNKIYNNIPSYEPFGYGDTWNKNIVKSKSKYKPIKVEVIRNYSSKVLGRNVYAGEIHYLDEERYEELKEYVKKI